MLNLRRRLSFVLALWVSVPVVATAYSVKSLDGAARGCIPSVSGQRAKDAIRAFNIRTTGATADEARALGTALTWIEALNNGRPLELAVADGDGGYTYRFASKIGKSHQGENEVLINRNGTRHYGQNVAQLAHELGHLIGNNGGYGEYRHAMKGKSCFVSSYSQSRLTNNSPKFSRPSSRDRT